MSLTNLKARLNKLKEHHGCQKCKNFNQAAYSLEIILKTGQNAYEANIPPYVCPSCGRTPPARGAYDHLVIALRAGQRFEMGQPVIKS